MNGLISKIKNWVQPRKLKSENKEIKTEVIIDQNSVFCRTSNFQFHYVRPRYLESIKGNYGYIEIKILTEEYEKKFQVGNSVACSLPTPTYKKEDFADEIKTIRNIYERQSSTMYAELDKIISEITSRLDLELPRP